jgi:hypothetical protein
VHQSNTAIPLKMRVSVLLLALPWFVAAANMNIGQYKIANSGTHRTDYHNDEFFEVYSPPIKTLYSQVFWKMQEAVPLPNDIQERFADKIMAVTGYEVDQVRITSGGGEKSIPITWAYNHHYGAYLSNSNKTRLVKRKAGKERMYMNHNSNEYWTAELIDNADAADESDIPLHIFFSEGNGGEFRLSYHGYPKGYAQLIESPDTFSCNPMQIDTWNRDHPYTSEFHPGPLPKSSRIPPSAGYSGLIECPCTDRLEIKWNMTYTLEDGSSSCTGDIQNATECFYAAETEVQALKHVTRTVSQKSRPHGCSVTQYNDGTVEAIWNTASGTPPKSAFDEHAPLIAFSHAQVNVTVRLEEDEATITVVGPPDRWFGVAFGSSTMCMHLVSDECPDGGPYAIVVSGEDYSVTERKLGFHGPGSILENSIKVISNSISSGNRTVVLSRPLEGASSNHYSFDLEKTSVPIITARGCSSEFAQHCGHGPSELSFLAVGSPKRICQAGISGTIAGDQFDNNRCAPSPFSDLQTQGNPTCAVQTYRGGLSCCRDGHPLLDQEQDIPWADQYLEYRLKFRFYFQEYESAVENIRPASHYSLVRFYWQTEAHAGEYDIEQCPEGTPVEQCIQVITSHWRVRDMMHECSLRPDGAWCTGKGSSDANKTAGIELIYAAPHCHAPSCLSMELYNADTGQLLCHVEPIFGQGDSDKNYDEHGFLAIPPCLWGDEKEGLSRPHFLSLDTTLLSIKRNNSTLPHTGEMASWQMRGIVLPKKTRSNFIPPETLTATDELATVETARRGQLRRNEN